MADKPEFGKGYAQDMIEELKKVSWPTRKQIIKLSLVVIIISIVVALYVGVLDVFLAKLLEFLTKVK